jgi:hypothetical protein
MPKALWRVAADWERRTVGGCTVCEDMLVREHTRGLAALDKGTGAREPA